MSDSTLSLSTSCDSGQTKEASSTREGSYNEANTALTVLVLSAWLATYLLFDFCKGFDCDAQEINWLHLASKKKKKQKYQI